MSALDEVQGLSAVMSTIIASHSTALGFGLHAFLSKTENHEITSFTTWPHTYSLCVPRCNLDSSTTITTTSVNHWPASAMIMKRCQ